MREYRRPFPPCRTWSLQKKFKPGAVGLQTAIRPTRGSRTLEDNKYSRNTVTAATVNQGTAYGNAHFVLIGYYHPQHVFFEYISKNYDTFYPYVSLCAGFPEALDDEALREAIADARTVNRAEAPRVQASRPPEDYGTRPSQLSDADIEALRGRFPILAELSTGFIRGCRPPSCCPSREPPSSSGSPRSLKMRRTSWPPTGST